MIKNKLDYKKFNSIINKIGISNLSIYEIIKDQFEDLNDICKKDILVNKIIQKISNNQKLDNEFESNLKFMLNNILTSFELESSLEKFVENCKELYHSINKAIDIGSIIKDESFLREDEKFIYNYEKLCIMEDYLECSLNNKEDIRFYGKNIYNDCINNSIIMNSEIIEDKMKYINDCVSNYMEVNDNVEKDFSTLNLDKKVDRCKSIFYKVNYIHKQVDSYEYLNNIMKDLFNNIEIEECNYKVDMEQKIEINI